MAVGFLSHRSRFDSNRPCRLPPAQDGMKLGTLVGGRVRVSLAPAAPPLDSRFAGMTRWGAGVTRPAGLMRWLVEVFAGHFHRAYPSPGFPLSRE